MNQKVWVLDDQYWKESPAKGRIEDSVPAKRPTDDQPLSKSGRKSPALSFSLSMLVWGSGQMYLGAYGPGTIYLSAMLFFYSTFSALVFYRQQASRFFAGLDLPKSALAIGALCFVAFGLVIWLANAVAAYCRAARLRDKPFQGVENDFCPIICSLLFPGWGQFLNGQPKKGAFFLLFGMAGILSAVICSAFRYLWPVLKVSQARFVSEIGLAVALSLIPISILMWIVATYDSLGTRRELARKRQMVHHSGYWLRSRGGLRNLIPRGTAVLGLLLAISVGMQCIPKKYYRDSLENIRIEALSSDMEIIPALIQKVNDLIHG